MIWLTSDWHFNHNREFIWKARGFTSIQEMNEAIIANHNSMVSAEDDVYVCGDLCLGDLELGRKCIERMNGKIHIICGNHDTDTRIQMYKELPNVVEVAEVGIRLKYGKYHFVLTHYPMLTGNLEKESLKQMSLNLYGHTHQKTNFFEDRPYMYHVGIDSHNCKPMPLDVIIEKMNEKVIECKDFL